MDYVYTFFMVQYLTNRTASQTSAASAKSLLECSRLCAINHYQCGAFFYEPQTTFNCLMIGQFEVSTHAETKYWIKKDHCPIQDGYLHLFNGNHGDHLCVTLETDKKNWEDADIDCKTRGDNLVTLDTNQKTVLMNNYLFTKAEFDQNWWIGLKDRMNNNVYTWNNGLPLTYENWQDSQPDYEFNGIDDDCGVLGGASQNFTWSDFNCLENLCSYICDKSLF